MECYVEEEDADWIDLADERYCVSDRQAFVHTVINLYFCEMREFLERLSNC